MDINIVADFIKKHVTQNIILYFEGSIIPGVAYFLKGFGTTDHLYTFYQKPFDMTYCFDY